MAIIRDAQPDDAGTIVQLIRDLGEYEKALEEVLVTEEQLKESLFCQNPKLFGHVLEHESEDGPVIAGFTLWFLNYSTWLGKHGIYLEDLYVRPEFRGSGYGKSLLQRLAQECVEKDYGRLEWSVLNWNEPSIEFYRRAGAVPMDEWTTFRLTGNALNAYAK